MYHNCTDPIILVDAPLSAHDAAGNGKITLDEFIEYMSSPPVKHHSDDELKARFHVFDKVVLSP